MISSSHKPWSKAVLHTARGFEPASLEILSGAIPVGLRGSLYRNGPGRLERGGQRVGHWFDGDGAILGVHFTNAGATGVYRYIQSAEYQAEEKASRLIYAGYGMNPPGAIWERFKAIKNAGNTSVVAFPDKLLALWEGGHPYELDLETLETRGLDDLEGLPKSLPFSAHPKCDAKTGDVFNFGISFGKEATLNLYRLDVRGKLKQKGSFELECFPLIHDFVLAGDYLIFIIAPVRLSVLPLLLRLKSFSDSFEWKPEKGTQILVFDRTSLTLVSRGETEPWYQWHFSNGFVKDDGDVMVNTIRYEDFNTNQYLKEVSTGETHTSAKSTLWQVRLNPLTGQTIETHQLLDRPCEFPIVKPQDVGQSASHTFLSIHRRGVNPAQDLFGAIARFDQTTGELMEADLGENRYPMEPIYAPDAENPDRGWIVTVVYDGTLDRSEIWVFDSDHLDDSPVCRLALPEVIPLGFHGTWKSA